MARLDVGVGAFVVVEGETKEWLALYWRVNAPFSLKIAL